MNDELQGFSLTFGGCDLEGILHDGGSLPFEDFLRCGRGPKAQPGCFSAAHLVAKLKAREVEAHHIDSFEEIAEWLKQHTHKGDLLVVMGAGPVWKVARKFMEG